MHFVYFTHCYYILYYIIYRRFLDFNKILHITCVLLKKKIVIHTFTAVQKFGIRKIFLMFF